MEVAMEVQTTPLSPAYFTKKKAQARKRAATTSGKVFDALEIATKVMRLCYPLPEVKAVRCYYNNDAIEPFIAPQHGQDLVEKHGGDIKDHVVVDIYFFLGFSAYEPKTEND